MNTKPVILIVAIPGDLQIGLQALLTTHLEVDILVTGKGSSALKVIERHKPALVILDYDLPKETVSMIIQHLKSNCPDIDCNVMVNDDEERQLMVSSGVDHIVLKGFPAAKLIALIESQLSQKENDRRIESDSQEETKSNSEGGMNTD